MKFTKLLVMSALWLVGLNANAADLIERTAPTQPSWAPKFGDAITLDDIVKEPAEFEVGQLYVLYNTGKQLYFSQGCSWATQASVDELPLVVRFSLPDGKTLEDQALLLNDYNLYTNKWNLTFFDSPTGMFTDRASQPNIYWNVISAGDKVYRLQASPLNPDYTPTNNPGFVGYDEATTQGGDTHGRGIGDNAWALSPFLNEDITHHIDWVFYKVNGLEPWQEYFDGLPIYEKAKTLKELIEKAEDAGIDVTAAVAVYNNLESTVADFDVVIKQLEDAIKNNIANATGQHPQDASAWIVNGTFNTIGNFEGWSTDKGKFGAGGTTSTNAEVYGKGAFDINQDITVKYPGLYVFGVKGFYRAGSADESYKRFSENSEDARLTRFYVTAGGNTSEAVVNNIFDGAPTTKPAHGKAMASNGYWIPNTMADANEFFHTDNLYSQFLPVEISGTDVTARIGVKKDVETSYDAWSIFDDFTLIYCGSGEDRYVGYAKTMAKAFPSYDNLTGVTESYKTAYLQLKNNPTGTNSDEAEAYIQSLLAAKAALELNITLWKTYEDSVAYALTFVQQFIDKGQGSVPAVANLNTYLQGRGNNATKIIAARALTNEELRAELDKLRDLIANVKTTVDVQPGTDMTDYLQNPAFDTNSWDGWTRVVKNAGNCAVAEQCAEAWNTESFDIYQEVSNMPVGVYEISVQGFYRYGRGSAFSDYKNGNAPKNSPTYIYMNANTTSFMNIFAEPRQITDENFYKNPDTNYTSYTTTIDGQETTLYFPNGMSSAARAFDNDMFVNSAYGAQVDMNDKMRLGVKGSSNQLGDSWVIFDNFKLTFWGKQADKVLPALDGAIAEMEAYLTDPNLRVGANITADLANAIGNANEVRNTKQDDGEAMFDALVALYAIKDKVRESEALLNNLALVADTLKDKLALAAMPVVLFEATNLLDEIGQNLQSRLISDSDVPGLIDQLHTQMANADKCIELRNAITNLEAVKANQDAELAEGKITQQWIDESANLLTEVVGAIDNGTLQFDEIPGWINKITICISDKYKPANLPDATDLNPVDCTAMIQSASFSKFDADQAKDVNSIDGWKGTDGYNFGNDDTQKSALALEFYHKAFNMYQDIAGLPTGIYEVRVNAFGRLDNKDTKDSTLVYANTMLNGDTIALNNVLAKDYLAGLVDTTDVAVITEIKDGDIDVETGDIKKDTIVYGGYWIVDNDTLGYTPNNMVSATKFFALNTEKYNKPYSNSVFVKVNEGETLRLGIFTNDVNTWAIMDDFRLICYGANSTKAASGPTLYSTGIEQKAVEAAEVIRTEYFSLNGVRTAAPQRGITIVRQTLSNGTVVVKKVNLK